MTDVIRRAFPILAATVLVACGGGSDTDATGATVGTDAPSPAPAAPAATAPPEAEGSGAPAGNVPEALQFSAPLVGGGEIELGALAGRPVLLWFWAPW